MDPVVVITMISSGLALVDQFRDLVLRFRRERVEQVSVTARQSPAGDSIEIDDHGARRSVQANDLKLDQWDEPRCRALERRVKINWDLYNELFAQNVGLAPDETARVTIRAGRVKDELCEDFHEMVGIYERVLGTGLPDHYQLYEVC